MNQQGRAYCALQQIKAIYKVEHECKHLDDPQRKAYRLKHAKPLLDELKKWAVEQINLQVTEKGLLGKALYYLVKHWYSLTRYLEEGYLKPDNNKAEQHMRPIALGRRNYLFVGSDRGGRAAATFYSLIESCKNYKINPIEYLTDMFTRLPYCETQDNYRALIPGLWVKQ